MPTIGPDELHDVLAALGDLLEPIGERFHLVVIGGSGLAAIGAVSRTTRDVDVVALERDGELIPAEPLPDAIRTAAATVARDLRLEVNWLNAGPSGLLDLGLPVGFASRLAGRDYGSMLRVSFAARIDQIFFKLYAFADREEPRDLTDLQQLDPTPGELRDAARWARTHNTPGPFDDQLARALGDLGVEDEGRNS
jgi:hypothetical protein